MADEKKQPGIFAAIAAAMGEVERVAKGGENKEQKYKFASVDDFLAMAGPICAKHGLVTIADEISSENVEKPGKFGVSQWVSFTFNFTTYHTSGEKLPTVRRSVEVVRSGAQASGAAQSYVLKQYLRALLMIPTGDKDDPDHGDAIEIEREERNNNRQRKQEQNQSQAESKPKQAESKPSQEENKPKQKINADQYIQIRDLAEKAGVPLERIANAAKINSIEELNADSFDGAIRKLNATIKANEEEAKKAAEEAEKPTFDDEIPY